ncbi:MAG TPA: hypothetical protein VGX25_01020 [Actinophytocola sp.]|uniref:hypothetical protein n=1 Tax=Actinophytocola sp. TaxID=1872138 RepID=UPI002DDD75F0|nr:hypothetical protein [Actinophytocola sp.]HEV2777958.1 hypothetical protein [Actinophytocola sp.]
MLARRRGAGAGEQRGHGAARRLGRPTEAAAAFDAALRLVRTDAERAHLRRRRAAL